MADRQQSKIQIGEETTRGTGVAATRILGADIGPIPLDRKWEPVKLATGKRSQRNAKRNDTYLVNDALKFSNAYYQLLPMLIRGVLVGGTTGAEQTASQLDYLWSATPALTGDNAQKAYTVELGDDQQEFEHEYTMFTGFKLGGQIPADGGDAPVSLELPYFARQIAESTFTASQALHTSAEFMNAKLARLYKDTTFAGVGGTEITNILRGFEIECINGAHPKFLGSGNKYFDSHGHGPLGLMLTLDLESGSAANTIYDEYQAGTERALRFAINGSQLGSGLNYRVRFDVFGYWETVVPLSKEIDSNNIHRAVFVSQEDSSGNYMIVSCVTNNNAI